MMPGRGGDAVRGVEVASLFGWLMSYHRREQLVSAYQSLNRARGRCPGWGGPSKVVHGVDKADVQLFRADYGSRSQVICLLFLLTNKAFSSQILGADVRIGRAGSG